jgi:hypothetical protein
MSPSHTGIRVYGRGHVVCHNRVSRFSDGIDIASVGMPGTDVDVQPVAIDFYNNDVSFAQDDAIETDYGAHNVRVYRNRCYNAHTGLSVQPFYGGPVYLVRNEIYGITSLALKLHNYCAGILAYHNTSACAGRAFLSFSRWQNGHLRNNLMLGGAQTRIAIETGTISAYSTLDYNGYRRFPGDIFIRWHDGRELKNYGNLEEFSRATGYERHGLLIDYDEFVRARPPQLGVTSGPGDYDLRLNPDARAVDAGIHLPNVNDDFAGKAPDLGCYERGSAIPLYGPRP